jgi:hypothetical protein
MGFTPNEKERVQSMYTDILKQWDKTDIGKQRIEQLILFIRGSKLPMSGWQGVKEITLSKRFKDDQFTYPQAHTCFSVLDVQPYEDQKTFEKDLIMSLYLFAATNGAMSMA